MMNDYMKNKRFITVHEENLSIAKVLGIIAIVISVFYTVRGLFYGESLSGGIKKSWLSGFGIIALLFVLIVALFFFLDWFFYSILKRTVIRKGTKQDGIIVSETEKKHTSRGATRLSWKYTIKTEEGTLYLSTAYINQIPLRKKCTVYILGLKCIITNFES